jgi:hypothetical protein
MGRGAGLVEDTRKYDNPPNLFIVKFVLIMFIILLTVAIIGLVYKSGPYDGWMVFFILTGGWSCFLLAIWYRQYFSRPKIVEISDEGLTLHMGSSKEIKLGWSELRGYWANNEETDAAKKTAGSGGIMPIKGPFYATNYYIAITVASEYHRITGMYLPATTMNESDRAFKKRVKRSN